LVAVAVLLGLAAVLSCVAATSVSAQAVPVIEVPPVEPVANPDGSVTRLPTDYQVGDTPVVPSPGTPGTASFGDDTIGKWIYCHTSLFANPAACANGNLGETDPTTNPFGGSHLNVYGSAGYDGIIAANGWTDHTTAGNQWDGTHFDLYSLQVVLFDPSQNIGINQVIGGTSSGNVFYVRAHADTGFTLGLRWNDGVVKETNYASGAWGDAAIPHLFQILELWQSGTLTLIAHDQAGGEQTDDAVTGVSTPNPDSYLPSGMAGPFTPVQIGNSWRSTSGSVWIDIQNALGAAAIPSYDEAYSPPVITPGTIEVPSSPETVPAPDPTPTTVPATVEDPGHGTDSTSIWDVIGNLGDRIANFFANALSGVQAMLDGLLGALTASFQWIVSAIVSALQWLGNLLASWLSSIRDVLISGFNTLTAWGTQAWNTMFDWMARLLDVLAQGFASTWGWLQNIVANIQALPGYIGAAIRTLLWPSVGWDDLVNRATDGTPVDGTPAVGDPFPLPPSAPVPDGPPDGGVPAVPSLPSPTPALACGPSFHVPAPVDRTIYAPTPSASGCPGNGVDGARIYADDQAGDVFGYRVAARSLAALFLWAAFIFKIARAMPWAGRDEFTEGLTVLNESGAA
jgi:hypothetical protein